MVYARQAGFGLIEVLVALVVICIGVLGMLSMQGRTVGYAQDTNLRSNAAELADELMEMMRADLYSTQDGSSTALTPPASWGYYKAKGSDFPSAPSNCTSMASLSASQRLGCWAQRAQLALPDSVNLMKPEFYICRSNGASLCSGTGSAIEIQVAWRVKAGECLDANAGSDSDPTICRYVLREAP
ncbi:type IV pilus modification protein PilV [Pseudomonas sp. PDM13]|uniref:type IV pilus modification protein PilV n=1 Tax=Pseudomonas sp. PDM13 TaxID=2769255 RepID=UPI0021E00A8A|nr:type IV pilus modification protein PilV [Pseudomonas sp. PDM13]MCU9949159.1 type IV pilus modification protein PilV [Pseudomonas sp. PDM13]